MLQQFYLSNRFQLLKDSIDQIIKNVLSDIEYGSSLNDIRWSYSKQLSANLSIYLHNWSEVSDFFNWIGIKNIMHESKYVGIVHVDTFWQTLQKDDCGYVFNALFGDVVSVIKQQKLV